MPRFFFDIRDGYPHAEDREGLDLEDAETARREALRALASVTADGLPDSDHHDLVVTVLDESRRAIFEASLSLTAEWLVERPARGPGA